MLIDRFVSVEATTSRQSSNASANDFNHTPRSIQSAPSAPSTPSPHDDIEREPEDLMIPKDSSLSDISEGPPRYRALFPPYHFPVFSGEGFPPPPTYEESQWMNEHQC